MVGLTHEQIETEEGFNMFEEPESFRPPPPKPSFQAFKREAENVEGSSKEELSIRLVGHHSLWAHCLWNAGVVLAHFFDTNKDLVKDKTVLELGAAAALPSFISAINDAKKVVTTDYPDRELIDNMQFNAESNVPEAVKRNAINVQGYLWGADPTPLLSQLPDKDAKFDVVVLADLIFNHTEHQNMLKTVNECLSRSSPSSFAVVIFTHHRPWLADRDMKFFDVARDEFGFIVEEWFVQKMPVMFPDDPGDEEVRRTVKCYKLRFAN